MPPISDAYWLAMRSVRGVGPKLYRAMLDRFETPERAIAAGESALVAAGVPRATAASVAGLRNFDAAERELCEMQRIGARLLRWTDAEYPANLRQIADPPPYLYIRGAVAALGPASIAIVGARAASDAGRHMARRLGLELASRGITVVSGLARGIDGEAHQGALDAGGRTVAVTGCGIDVIYPAEHRALAEAILETGGAMLSELPIGTSPRAENFPARNRILSGLCLGVVIVEAAERSGSLITARLALEQNRQVFAVPGSPLSGKSRGSNRLLKEGARLVECVEDIIEELAPQMTGAGFDQPKIETVARKSQPERKFEAPKVSIDMKSQPQSIQNILTVLKNTPKMHVDAIIEESGMNAQTVLRLLLDLELKGLVAQHPGKLFTLA
jgi:DNA processing protein